VYLGWACTQTDKQILADRQRAMDDWTAWYASKSEWLDQQRNFADSVLGNLLTEREYTVSEVEVEETISFNEEVIKG
jgi:hypothetical protein